MSMEYVSLLASNFDDLAEEIPDMEDIAGYTLQEWADYAVIGWDEMLGTYFVSFGDYDGDGDRERIWDFGRPGLVVSPWLLAAYLQSMIPGARMEIDPAGINALLRTRNRGASAEEAALFAKMDEAGRQALEFLAKTGKGPASPEEILATLSRKAG